MTRAADDPIVRAEIHDALTACGLDPVTEGAIDGVIALAGAGTHSYSDAAQVATEAVNRYDLRPRTSQRAWSEHPTQGDGLIVQADYARFSGQLDTLLDGATTPGAPNTWPANAGEYAARWNAHDPQWREDHVTGHVDIAQRASRCIEHDHEGKIRHLEQGWKDSTNAWQRVHQHPKVAALDDHYMPLVDQVLHALHQPHKDTALAEGSTYGSVDELIAAGQQFRGESDQFAELITELADTLAAATRSSQEDDRG